MISPYGFLGYTLLQTLSICAVFVALCDIAKCIFKLDELLTFCVAVLAIGLLGYLSFWLAYANYAVFGTIKVAVLAALVIWFGAIVYQRRIGGYRWLAEPLLYTSLFCTVVLTLGFSDGGLDSPSMTAAHRFSQPLPMDNVVPWLMAEALKFGTIPTAKLGDWLTSDRPPLQVGLYLLLSLRNDQVHYQIVSAWLQATFLFGVWGVMVASMLMPPARRIVLLACCLLPTAIINTLFVWPKLLSTSYLLLVLALLFCRKPEPHYERMLFGILIGGLAALAMLTHGSAVLALIGFAVVVLAFWAWPPLKTMISGAATMLVIYVPWMLYQSLIDPPGNRLLKWHLAGVIAVDDRSFLQALRDSYGALSWQDYLQGRAANLQPLIGSWPKGLLDPLIGPFTGHWTPVAIRDADFFRLMPSLHIFSTAIILAVALLLLLPRRQRIVALQMFVSILGTLAAFVILIFIPGQTINHQNTYAVQVLATTFAFMVLTQRTPWLALLFIAAQAVTVSATYAFSLKHDPALWPLLAACVAASLTLAGYSLLPSFVRAG
jgi:hypothetical protein